ncbi:uncharacterized protein LOC110037100 isoform X2 [Phalaenopsis equestris]|uniref:uncharacterized protein LOC110037100 isoform X2 n=1 Tax=Phalaenopsis equestris TaxID=78828 RepID=UPI0009E2D015|nr:uncharacterized protein LOC110037100 isoform X2 [Phalaenopsis equestris]
MEATNLLIHLHKLSPATSKVSLVSVLETLWETRKSGLSPLQKSHVQSLLNLPVSGELDPVLSCLRLIIRKVSKEKLSEEDIQKLFPVDLSADIKKTLVTLLQKYQIQWEKEVAREQTMMMFPGRVDAPPAYVPLQTSNLSTLPGGDNTRSFLYGVNNGCTISSFTDVNIPRKSSLQAIGDNGSSNNLFVSAGNSSPAEVHDLEHGTKEFNTWKSLFNHYLEVA